MRSKVKKYSRIGFYGIIAGIIVAVLMYLVEATFVAGVAVGGEVSHFLWNAEYLQELVAGVFLGYLTDGMRYTFPLIIAGEILLAYRTTLSRIPRPRIAREGILIGILAAIPSILFGFSLLIWSVYSMRIFIIVVTCLAVISLVIISVAFSSSMKWFAAKLEEATQ